MGGEYTTDLEGRNFSGASLWNGCGAIKPRYRWRWLCRDSLSESLTSYSTHVWRIKCLCYYCRCQKIRLSNPSDVSAHIPRRSIHHTCLDFRMVTQEKRNYGHWRNAGVLLIQEYTLDWILTIRKYFLFPADHRQMRMHAKHETTTPLVDLGR